MDTLDTLRAMIGGLWVLLPILADAIAPFFLVFMPFSFAAKTLAVASSVELMARQDPVDKLGVYIFRFYLFLLLTSAGLTGMFGALAWTFHDSAGLGDWILWMVLVEVAANGSAYFGHRMVREERRLWKTE